MTTVRSSRPANDVEAHGPCVRSDTLRQTVAVDVRSGDVRSVRATVLFTDIEGSTRLWEAHPDAMRVALARHDEIVRAAIEANAGLVYKMVGDAVHAVFVAANDALEAAVTAQRALGDESWPEDTTIRVRMALHSGECVERDGDFVGPMLNRLARTLGVAHAGQVLLSAATERQLRGTVSDPVSLVDLGEHRLRDLLSAEHLFQVRAPGLIDDFAPLRSLGHPAMFNNLPEQLTGFVGRERELREMRELLDDGRVVTITGSGGVGKTRLALQVAAELLDGSGDGVWLVELAPLVDPELVAPTVASVLHVGEEPGRPALDALTDALRDRAVLIVLDNCEHVVGAAAEVVECLVRSCPNVEILATSREPLRVPGERVFRLPSLSFPPDGVSVDAAALHDYEAVALFGERAAQHQPGFEVGVENASAVASVCRRLDGIPLALELAAARLRFLTIQEIDRRLNDRFRLLAQGARTALPRQQTLRALVDWSCDLLSDPERVVLARCSVFAGGYDGDAAEAVLADGVVITDTEIVDLVGALVDKSLVQAEPRAGATRYRVLETIREHGAERLASDTADELSTHLRHRDHYLAFAEGSAARLFGPDRGAALEQLAVEHDNLRAALVTTRNDPDGAAIGLRFVAALVEFWRTRGYAAEGMEITMVTLNRPDAAAATAERAVALVAAADLRLDVGKASTADALANDALSIALDLGLPELIEDALLALSWSARQHGDLDTAQEVGRRALAAAYRTNEQRRIGRCLHILGIIAVEAGNPASGRALLEQALSIRRAEGDRTGEASVLTDVALVEIAEDHLAAAGTMLAEAASVARALHDERVLMNAIANLGLVAVRLGDPDAASRNFNEMLELSVRCGWGAVTGYALLGCALTATLTGRFERAAVLHGAADLVMEQVDQTFMGIEVALRDDDRERLRSALGNAAFTRAELQGRTLSRRDIVAFAMV